MANIFLDIGAHIGESLEIAIKPKYSFDRLIEVEPSFHAIKYLRKYRDSRIEILPVGFGSNNGNVKLHGAGSVGASIHLDKTPWWNTSEIIQIVKFSTWFKSNIQKTDSVWLKINVEGAENEIVDEILLLNDYKFKSILISFDVEKVPNLRGMKGELIRKLNTFPGIESWRERTRDYQVEDWLDEQSILSRNSNLLENFIAAMGLKLPISRRFRRLVRPLIPRKLWLFLAIKLGPNRKR